MADPDDHNEGGRWAGSVRVHPIPQLEQIPRPFLDGPFAAEFDLHAEPRAARRLDDSVHFQAGVVAVVVHLGVVRLGIDPKVPHGQRLEEEPEGADIGPQPVRAGTKCGNRQRRIDEVPLGRSEPGGEFLVDDA